MKTAATWILLLSLAGCARNAPSLIVPATTWADRVKVSDDDYVKIRTYTGAAVEGRNGSVMLRAFQPRGATGAVTFQAYIVARYAGEWYFHDRAHDIDGTQLPARFISRNVTSCRAICIKEEHVAIDVSREYLWQRVDRGVDVQLSGKGGKQQFFLPPAYIEAFLAELPPVR